MRLSILVGLLALCASIAPLFADQLVLKNGDRLSGTIVKSDEKTLVIKTEFEGEVKVDWSAVQEMNSNEPLHVTTDRGNVVAGTVSTADGNLTVNTPAQGPVVVPKDAIKSIRNGEEQTAYEKSLHPGLLQDWQGGANVGFALTGGNSQTTNVNLGFTAERESKNDDIHLYANSVYATNNAPGAVPSTTANAVQGGARYDRNFDTRLFGFVSGDFQSDALQTLDLRSILGGGLGVHAIKHDRTTLDLLSGLSYTRENYSAFDRNLISATLGDDFSRKIGTSTLLTQHIAFYPDFNQAGEYRGTFNFATVTKINKWLGWQNTLSDIYASNPPVGKKQNDIILSTGFNLSFTR